MPKFKIALRAFALASAVLFAVSGCGGGNNHGDTPPGEVSSGIVAGRVADAQTGEAIAGVEVKIGGLKAISDANGKYSVPGVPLGAQVVAQFSKASYAPNFATVEVVNGKTSSADRRLAKVAVRQDLSAANGGVVILAGSAAQVQLPAAGFVNAATGAAFSGTVSVEMTPINPGIDPLNMPGNYRAQGEPAPIESFGALQVELRDATGAMLNLAPGKTATIRIPVPPGAKSPPISIPLYYFKESSGLWVREGTATLAGNLPQQYYEGQVSHFSTWNADRSYETIFINGCVVNSKGQPVDASVFSDGIDYFGSAYAHTTADGKFTIAARRSSQVEVRASSGPDSDSVIVTTGLTDITLPACLVVAQKPPVIVTQPGNLTLATGTITTLNVMANNADQYKWYRNGELIDSGSRFLTMYGSASAAGTYHVIVSNAYGSVTSASVTVTVAPAAFAPTITAQPQDVSVLAGATPSFSVQAQGDSLTYQWLRNGTEIGSAQGSTLTLGPVSAADNGAVFSVRIKNGAGTLVSANAVLNVTAEAVAPAVTVQPTSTSVAIGQNATFNVVASGTAPFTYQWLRNASAIDGATAATYQTSATTLADNGALYTVRITNAKGSVLSAAATLKVSQTSSVPGLHLAFPTGFSVDGQVAYGAIPAGGGIAVPFWPAGAGPVTDYMVQAQLNNGVASNMHIRAMMFWKNQQLVRRDLVGVNGLPAEVRVSSISSASLCEGSSRYADTGADLTDANRSWHVYRKRGPDAACGTDDDQYYAVRANMSALDAPLEVLPPVATLHSPAGALTGWIVRNGQQVQRLSADFTNPVTLFALPGTDLDVDDNSTPDTDWIFESGHKIYAVNLSAAAPAALTMVATLADGESMGSISYGNGQDAVITISGATATRILRYAAGSKAVNAVATITGMPISETVTPTRVVLHMPMGPILSVPLSGGTPQLIYTSPAGNFTYTRQHSGERLWIDLNGSVVSLNSDGSGLQTLADARLAGCILKAQTVIDGGFDYCDAVIVIQGGTVRSHDAATGAARVTYGTITMPAAPLTTILNFSFLTAWGQTGVLSQYSFDPTKQGANAVAAYLIKTDQAGITPIVMP